MEGSAKRIREKTSSSTKLNAEVLVAERTTLRTVMFMALTFQVDDKGQLDPKIRCDGCGGIIKNYADGFALVDTPSPKDSPKVETISDPIFLCAGCEKSEQRKGDSRRSMPLDHFMLYLMNNIQLTPRVLEDAGHKLRDASAWR
jgi:hypothetical protein